MKTSKWVFLLSYLLFLVFGICFNFISQDESAINSMMFAITIASTSFSISDLLFTKVSIEENERKSMFAVLYLSDRVKEYYIKKIQERYGRDAQRIVSSLLKLFNDDLDIVVNFFEGNISEEEKERFLQTVNACGDEKLIKFVNSFSEEDVSDVRETTEEK